MRKRRRSAPHTGKSRSKAEAGSIALEASLVLPMVLMAVIFFICLIRINAAQMALHGAVSQTVRQAAANIHPIELAVRSAPWNDDNGAGAEPNGDENNPSEGGGSALPSAPPSGAAGSRSASGEPLPAVRYLADKLESWLPSPAGPLLAAALKGDWKTIQDSALAVVGGPVIEPMLRHEADSAVLNPQWIRLSKLSLPDLKNGKDDFLVIEAEYAFHLGFPFTKKTLVLKERAAERVWTPDPLPARRESGADSEHAPIQIVSIEPSPVRPGNKARVVVKTSPGRSLSIQVLYKSGKSVAKHLGDTVTDSEGMAEWTWLVSGNTTPGTWEITVTASDGVSASRHFVVQKKQERT